MEEISDQQQQFKENPLTPDQVEQLRIGLEIKEMTASAGWKTVKSWLDSRANHSWVDPRGMTQEEWEWAELNAFHSHDVAEQLLADIQEAINLADQIENVRLGKDQPNRMRI